MTGANFELSSSDGSTFFDVRATVSADDDISTVGSSYSAIAKAAAINDLSSSTGVRAIVGETTVTGTDAVDTVTLNASSFFSINDVKIAGFTVADNDADGNLVDAINAVSDETGAVASLDANGQLSLTAADGRNISVSFSDAGVSDKLGNFDAFATGTNAATVSAGGLTFTATANISLQSNNNFEIRTANASTLIGFQDSGEGVYGVNSDKAVTSVDVSSRSGAVEALDVIDLALENVSASRAKLGALQNRLESTINNLSTTSENLSASRSRILDADFASETAQLSRNQIIQQAGVSILAQANQQPQVALALLG